MKNFAKKNLINIDTSYLLINIYKESKKIMDELTKKKISYSMRGKKKSATHKKRISQAMKRIKMTEEHKKAIAEAMKIMWLKKKMENE